MRVPKGALGALKRLVGGGAGLRGMTVGAGGGALSGASFAAMTGGDPEDIGRGAMYGAAGGALTGRLAPIDWFLHDDALITGLIGALGGTLGAPVGMAIDPAVEKKAPPPGGHWTTMWVAGRPVPVYNPPPRENR